MGRFVKSVSLVRSALAGLGDLFVPGLCPGCSQAKPGPDGLCQTCNVELLSLVALPYCPRCGSTLGVGIPAYDDGCWQCPNPLPRFDRVFRLGPYAGPLRRAIRSLKYHGRQDLLGRLGGMLAQVVRANSHEPLLERYDVIVPATMHWVRRLVRGADHAALLANALSKPLGVPCGQELRRVRNTPPQVYLSRAKRIVNVRGAFIAPSPLSVQGSRVLWVDDVTTTGATANECARTLLQAGATCVSLAVIAKAEKPAAYTEHWQNV